MASTSEHEVLRRLRQPPGSEFASPPSASIDLYWLPLGAGGHSVRLNGRIFEAFAARLDRRPRCDLYHSALVVHLPETTFVIEQAPIRPGDGAERGVVAEGAVGVGAAGRFQLFRYEVRRWRDGIIPDIDEAVESPHRLSDDPDCARRLLELVPHVPTPVWGRDELGAGEMWNSNSLISWLIARSGLDVEAVHPPLGGRAPGWRAGIVVARRQVDHVRRRERESRPGRRVRERIGRLVRLRREPGAVLDVPGDEPAPVRLWGRPTAAASSDRRRSSARDPTGPLGTCTRSSLVAGTGLSRAVVTLAQLRTARRAGSGSVPAVRRRGSLTAG